MSALNEHLLPKGVTVIEVGFTADVIPAYPLPLLITSTEVIIPLVTFALILPNLPFPLIVNIGAVVYTLPPFNIATSSSSPVALTIGCNSASFPVTNVTIGFLIKLTILVTPYPTPPDLRKILSTFPFTSASAVAV